MLHLRIGLSERPWSIEPAGKFPAIFITGYTYMREKILSVFIDESGDFGPYAAHSPYYLVAMVLHDQAHPISEDVSRLDDHLAALGYPKHAIHTGPIIRHESIYSDWGFKERKKLFDSLFQFSRKVEFRYCYSMIRKDECHDVISMTAKLSKSIAAVLREHEDYFNGFDRIVMYYDNGQVELTKILTSVFNTLFGHVEFRKVKPVDYKLFQVADLICTMELLSEKFSCGRASDFERDFFGGERDFRKNYLKPLTKKRL